MKEKLLTYSSRSGCSITLSLLGASKETVANHVGWTRTKMVDHYNDLQSILRLDAPAALLESLQKLLVFCAMPLLRLTRPMGMFLLLSQFFFRAFLSLNAFTCYFSYFYKKSVLMLMHKVYF